MRSNIGENRCNSKLFLLFFAACQECCCAYTQRTYPNGHALGDRVPTAFTGPSRPLLHMRLKAFAGPFGVCYQVVTRTTWQLVAVSDSQLNSISSQTAAAAVAPSRATTRCPASLLASRRTYTALYRIYPHQRLSRYKRSWRPGSVAWPRDGPCHPSLVGSNFLLAPAAPAQWWAGARGPDRHWGRPRAAKDPPGVAGPGGGGWRE